MRNQEEEKNLFKDTLLIPKSDFPIKHKEIGEKEEEIRKKWEEDSINEKNLEINKGKEKFLLHSGPTYANGKIHVGHVLNYILKDIIIRWKSLQGFFTPFVLGWDAHGLPIEHKVLQEFKKEKNKDYNEEYLRERCNLFALEQIKIQKEQLKKLGLLTNYERNYITLEKNYEYEQIKLFAKFVENNLIYQDLRITHWSWSHQTALAENEIEYKDKEDTSLYFIIELERKYKGCKQNVIVWTTQPWTIPSNYFLAINKKINYLLFRKNKEIFIIAEERYKDIKGIFGNESEIEIIEKVSGERLINLRYRHPYKNDEFSYIVDGSDFVQAKEGSGIVHIAPGFGEDDFLIAKENKKKVLIVMKENGCFNSEINDEEIIGKHYTNVNDIVVKKLEKEGKIIKKDRLFHSYPHDWRDKKPLIFRLTNQWFVKIEELKKDILEEIEKVEWNSLISHKKMRDIMESRRDWCISRQRKWGLPPPIIYDKNKKPLLELKLINFIGELFRKKGSGIWFNKNEMLDLLRKEFPKLICPESSLGEDTMDVWFDSGISHVVIKKYFLDLEKENRKKTLIDLYVEGKDQFRGWFNSSLIISVAADKRSPYKSVLSHGFVVDEKGNKMSKSLENIIDPEDLIKKYETDVLRMWVASSDFSKEVKISHNILIKIQEGYRKIRNSLRFIIGNLNNYEVKKEEEKDLGIFDYYILNKLSYLKKETKKSYDNYNFTNVYFSLLNFCTGELSSIYFEISKDILYCDKVDSLRRRKILRTLFQVFHTILEILEPIAPFLIEEAYSSLHNKQKNLNRYFRIDFLKEEIKNLSIEIEDEKKEQLELLEDELINLRKDIFKLLENLREKRIIKSNSQAEIDIFSKEEKLNYNLRNFPELERFLGVSSVNVLSNESKKDVENENFNFQSDKWFISARKTKKNNCTRCWKYEDLKMDNLCYRCNDTIKK